MDNLTQSKKIDSENPYTTFLKIDLLVDCPEDDKNKESRKKEAKEELATFSETLRKSEKYLDVYTPLIETIKGRIKLKEGNSSEALYHFGKALAYNPNHPWYNHNATAAQIVRHEENR